MIRIKKIKKRRKKYLSYDATYKLLFSDKLMVISFLLSFLPHELLVDLDFDTLTPYVNEYIGRYLEERRSDIIWKIQFKSGEWLYLFIMLEFQSSIDHYMALRICEYACMLLHNLARTNAAEVKEGLPPVLPIVIYNGDKLWKAPCDLSELYASMPKRLHFYQPNQHFILVDLHRLSDTEINKGTGVATILAKLERCKNIHDLRNIVDEIVNQYDNEKYKNIVEIFAEYINTILYKKGRVKNLPVEIRNMREIKIMLETSINNWENDIKQESYMLGKAEGIEIGKMEGIEIGKVEGIEIGKEEGFEIGRAETYEKNIQNVFLQCQSLNMSQEQTIKFLSGAFGLSETEAIKKIVAYLQ